MYPYNKQLTSICQQYQRGEEDMREAIGMLGVMPPPPGQSAKFDALYKTLDVISEKKKALYEEKAVLDKKIDVLLSEEKAVLSKIMDAASEKMVDISRAVQCKSM